MTVPIHILLLEDSAADAALIERALREGMLRFTLERVESRAAFARRLEQAAPDLILSDFSLPDCGGHAALALARELRPHIPFIFVTGSVGEEVVIETLKRGAADYVLKHRLGRLVPAVLRALREARAQTDRQRAEERLRQSREQWRAFSRYLQYVREEECIRVAREVHEELGQSLTGLKLALTWLEHRFPPQLKPLHSRAQAMARHIDKTLSAVRRIATELRPNLLDTAGLLAALEWQAQEFENRTGIGCRVSASLGEMQWDQDLNTAFFRIFQESLDNILRHTRASRVEVRLLETDEHLVLKVRDNGCGISPEEIGNTKSTGLIGMRQRAAVLGGEVHWHGEPGKGTTVTVQIPRPRVQPMLAPAPAPALLQARRGRAS